MIRLMEPTRDGPQLAVERLQEDGAQVIELVGELDLGSIPEFDRALDAAAGAAVICLDLARLDFIDSTGLAGIVRAHQRAEQAGGALTIVAPPGIVRRTLETSGLMQILRVVDDRTAALRGGA
jgi:anti-sigma B factor antagonist